MKKKTDQDAYGFEDQGHFEEILDITDEDAEAFGKKAAGGCGCGLFLLSASAVVWAIMWLLGL